MHLLIYETWISKTISTFFSGEKGISTKLEQIDLKSNVHQRSSTSNNFINKPLIIQDRNKFMFLSQEPFTIEIH